MFFFLVLVRPLQNSVSIANQSHFDAESSSAGSFFFLRNGQLTGAVGTVFENF